MQYASVMLVQHVDPPLKQKWLRTNEKHVVVHLVVSALLVVLIVLCCLVSLVFSEFRFPEAGSKSLLTMNAFRNLGGVIF